MYVFTGRVLPFHSGVCVSGHFSDLAAVAFLPPLRSPAKSIIHGAIEQRETL